MPLELEWRRPGTSTRLVSDEGEPARQWGPRISSYYENSLCNLWSGNESGDAKHGWNNGWCAANRR